MTIILLAMLWWLCGFLGNIKLINDFFNCPENGDYVFAVFMGLFGPLGVFIGLLVFGTHNKL